jgi:TolC family type I secretion outer membrane protein
MRVLGMRRRRALTVFVLIAAGVALVTPVRSAAAETLEDAFVSAYATNPQLEAQRARLRATDELVPQALSGYRPTLFASGEAGRRRVDQNQVPDRSVDFGGDAAERNLSPTRLAAEIEQPVFRGGQTLAGTRQAENAVRAERARLVSIEQQVLRDTAEAFMRVFSDLAEVALNVRSEQRFARQLEAARDRFEVGEVTRTDVFQAEAALAQATAERIQAEGRLDASRAIYRSIVGRSPENLQKPDLPKDMPATLDQAVERSIDGNPDVTARLYDEQSALDNIDRVRGQLLPSVSLVGRVERDEEQFRTRSRTNTYSVLARMTVPLYQGGTEYSQLREARQTAIEQRRLFDDSQRFAVRSTTEAWTALLTAQAAIVAFGKQVEANRVALEGVQREAEVGARTVLDILDAEQALLDSEVNLVRAQRDEIVAAYDLRSAMGLLTARHLDLPVAYYDPLVHYRQVRDAWFGTWSEGDTRSDFQPQQ